MCIYMQKSFNYRLIAETSHNGVQDLNYNITRVKL